MVVGQLVIWTGIATNHYEFLADWFSPVTYVAAERVEAAEVADLTPQQLEKEKDKVVEMLAQCESDNAPESKGLVTYDNNKSGTLTGRHIPSYGVLQMKVATVIGWGVALKKEPKMSDYEAILLALDNEAAKPFAREVIFTLSLEDGLKQWTCANPKYAKDPKKAQEMINRVEFINQFGK